jgi:hypothetical protein
MVNNPNQTFKGCQKNLCSSCVVQLQGLINRLGSGVFFFSLFLKIKFVAQVARVRVKAKPIWLFGEHKCDVCGYAAIKK